MIKNEQNKLSKSLDHSQKDIAQLTQELTTQEETITNIS